MRKALLTLFLSLCPLGLAGQNYAVSSNLADLATLGTLNLSADCGLARRWTVLADLKYNPFSYSRGSSQDDVLRLRQRAGAVGFRFWPWHIYSGWWLSGRVQYQEYSQTGLRSVMSKEGDRTGGGLSGGYSYMISPHLNLNVGLGFWAGYDSYVVYACPRCGRKVDSGEKTFLLPNDIQFSFSYVF